MKENWGILSLKERFCNSSSILFIIFILFYGIQLISALFTKAAPIIDLSVAVLVLALFFILHLIVKFNNIIPIFIGLSFLLHTIGLYNIIPYNDNYVGTLYGAPQLNYHYDWIVHFFSIFFASIAFCSIMYSYYIKGFKSKFLVFVLVLFFMMGVGAFNEVIEYVGFDVFGYGEGFLEFGDGDSSPVGGPWENASMDMIFNLMGAMIGVGGYLLIKKYKESG